MIMSITIHCNVKLVYYVLNPFTTIHVAIELLWRNWTTLIYYM